MNQIARLPLVSRQRMSPLPSPLKSAVATTVQVVGTLPTPADDETWRAVHEPDRRIAAGVTPEQVATCHRH